jgi:DNA-binding NarL/FixJ family response regulator
MLTSADDPANGTQPSRILIVDDHEISRAAYGALLRTEGLDIVADTAVGDQALEAARRLRPEVAIVDVAPAAATAFGIADELLALPNPPVVILTSSADRAEFAAGLRGHRFIGKAHICATAIDRLARMGPAGNRLT